MALFGSKEDKEAKQAEKEQALLDKYGLGELTDPADVKSIQSIVTKLTGPEIMEFGAMLAPNEKAREIKKRPAPGATGNEAMSNDKDIIS